MSEPGRPAESAAAADSYEAAIRVRQVAILVRQTPIIALGNLVSAALVCGVFWGLGSRLFLICWAALMWTMALARLRRWWRNRGRPPPAAVDPAVTARATRWGLATGALWGAAGFILYPPSAIAHQFLLIFVIGGMATAAVASLFPLLRLCFGYILTSMLPLIASFVIQGDAAHLTMGGMLAFYTGALLVFGRNGHQAFLGNERVKLRNAGLSSELEHTRAMLVDAIESASEGFALFDRDDRLVLCNENFRRVYPSIAEDASPGARFIDLMRAAAERGDIPSAAGRVQEWLDERLEPRRGGDTALEEALGEGRWYAISERRTERGGIVGVWTDISGLKAREKALEKARADAEQANRAKSEFVGLMSHELRTPLNAIIGFSDIIAGEVLGPHGVRRYGEYGADINRAGRHLLKLINDILDLSKIEADKMELREEAVDLGEAIAGALRLVEGSAKEARLELLTSVPERFPFLYADPRAVKQMLVNLLSNAVKFTPLGGSIEVAVVADEEGLALAVRDTGIGIAEKDFPKVFEPFGQVDSGLNRERQGTGLGVPLVRSLMTLHGGAFELMSRVGVGTVATLKFGPERIIVRPLQ